MVCASFTSTLPLQQFQQPILHTLQTFRWHRPVTTHPHVAHRDGLYSVHIWSHIGFHSPAPDIQMHRPHQHCHPACGCRQPNPHTNSHWILTAHTHFSWEKNCTSGRKSYRLVRDFLISSRDKVQWLVGLATLKTTISKTTHDCLMENLVNIAGT